MDEAQVTVEIAVIAELDQLQRDVYAALASPGRLFRPGERLSRSQKAAVRRVCEMLQEVRQLKNAALPVPEVTSDCDVMRQLRFRSVHRARFGPIGDDEKDE